MYDVCLCTVELNCSLSFIVNPGSKNTLVDCGVFTKASYKKQSNLQRTVNSRWNLYLLFLIVTNDNNSNSDAMSSLLVSHHQEPEREKSIMSLMIALARSYLVL